MYIGLKNIQARLHNYETLLTASDGLHFLTGWMDLKNASPPYNVHTLYVCGYQDLPAFDQTAGDIHVLCIAEQNADLEGLAASIPYHVSALLVSCDTPDAVYTFLYDFFNCQLAIGVYGQTLLEFLSFDSGLQTAVDYSYSAFRNPVFVFDTNFNLIAATWEQIHELGIEDDIIINKRFTENEFKMASRDFNLHSRVMESELPIIAFNETLGYEQMYCAINTQKNLGHIVVSAVRTPFHPIHTELMLLLKKFVDQHLRKDTFTKNARGFNYEYFLRDLLDAKIGPGFNEERQMQYTGTVFKGNLYCMVIELSRGSSIKSAYHIRNLAESCFPFCKTLIYNGQVVVILSFPEDLFMSREYLDAAQELCADNDLHAGLSNCFTGIINVRTYYRQALMALEYGTADSDSPGLYDYADHYLRHILQYYLQEESPDAFCHPMMKVLLEYDKVHRLDLSYTLYMYLVNERNLTAAADAMGMHRTSLVYRFRKISELIGDDYGDYRERLHLILSYEMYRAAIPSNPNNT